jgi:anti-sigma-K factor RskA
MSPSASARVFLDPTRRRAIVFFYNLPTNPNDKSYQLWIIRGDQPNPQSAGVFDVAASGNASLSIDNLPVMTEIRALAVTMELRGGVNQPAEKKFYVMGGMS